MLALIWSEDALDQLEDLTTYIAQFDETAAFAMRQRIEQSVLPACTYPEMFRAGRIPGTREVVAHPNYIVVYTVLPDRIQVVSVLHARQKYP